MGEPFEQWHAVSRTGESEFLSDMCLKLELAKRTERDVEESHQFAIAETATPLGDIGADGDAARRICAVRPNRSTGGK